jgi:hypothetical protein
VADYIFRVKNGIAVNTNLIYATAGQVGFNTTTPDANVTIVGTANVQGAFSVTGTSAHTLASSFANSVTVTGAVTLSNTISVTGAAILSSTLSVTGTSGYTGAATFSNTVSVTGTSTLSNTLTVAGLTTLQSLTVNAISASISAAGSNTATLYLGNTAARALVYDGTQYTLNGAQLLINGAMALHAANYSSYVNSISPTLTGSGASGNWAINVTGTSTNITAYTVNQNLGTTSSPQFNALTLAAGDLTLQRSGAPTTGLVFFGNSGTRYLSYDASHYSFVGATGANIYINGYVVLNAANYNSYSPTLTGTGASGSWGISVTGTASNITAYTINQSVGTASYPTFAGLLATNDITTYRSGAPATGLIFFGNTGAKYLYLDGSNYSFVGGNGLYVGGSLVLNAGNYNNYSPTLTGGNASGTWGINITGNAATVTNGVYNTGGTYNINVTGNAATATTAATATNAVNLGGVVSSSYITQASYSKTLYNLSTNLLYDSDNTGYYVDPNGLSYMSQLLVNVVKPVVNNWWVSNDGINRLYFQNAGSTYVQGYNNANWYIQFGDQANISRTIMEGNGNIYTVGNITAYWSDRRLKKNIHRISDWREIMNKINGYRFEWNENGLRVFGEFGKEDGVMSGLVAQEVKEAFPQAATVQMLQYEDYKDGVGVPRKDLIDIIEVDDPFLTVREEKLIPVLVEAIKGLMAEVDELKAKLGK